MATKLVDPLYPFRRAALSSAVGFAPGMTNRHT